LHGAKIPVSNAEGRKGKVEKKGLWGGEELHQSSLLRPKGRSKGEVRGPTL